MIFWAPTAADLNTEGSKIEQRTATTLAWLKTRNSLLSKN